MALRAPLETSLTQTELSLSTKKKQKWKKGSALEKGVSFRIENFAGRGPVESSGIHGRNLRIEGEKERNLGLRRPASLEKLPAVPSSLTPPPLPPYRRALRRRPNNGFRKSRTFANRPPIKRPCASRGGAAASPEDPFGRAFNSNGALKDAFIYRFSTKPLDAATGLYYYIHRYYDPLTGRWLSRDPINEKAFRLFNLDRRDNRRSTRLTLSEDYQFVHNSPVTVIDKNGLASPIIIVGVPVLVGLGYAFACELAAEKKFEDATKWAEALTGTKAVDPGTPADALRHCAGSCESMKISCCLNGPMKAMIQFRERTNGPAERIDKHNNQVGFAAGEAGKDCKQACTEALQIKALKLADSEPHLFE